MSQAGLFAQFPQLSGTDTEQNRSSLFVNLFSD
jgi:hypothetical protein